MNTESSVTILWKPIRGFVPQEWDIPPRREKAKCKGKVNKEVQDSVMDVKQL